MTTSIKVDRSGSIVGDAYGSSRFLYSNSVTKVADYFYSGNFKIDSGDSEVTLLRDINYCILSSDDVFQVKTLAITGFIETSLFSYDGVSTSIIVKNPNDSDISISILSMECLAASFEAEQAEDSLEVEFTDTSIGSTPTSWLWDFGDGNTSTEQTPTNEYDEAGTYTVVLTVVDAVGSRDTVTDMVAVEEVE